MKKQLFGSRGARSALVLAAAVAPSARGAVIDVFLVGGQSNADGRADPSTLPASLSSPQADVPIYYGLSPSGSSTISSQGLTTLRPGISSTGQFGPEVTFGRSMADYEEAAGNSVALIKYADGGTTLATDWKAGGTATTAGDGAIYQNFQTIVANGLAAIRAANPTATIDVSGMIWMQGESDCNGNSAAYQANLTNFVSDIRLTYGANLPFVIGELSVNQTGTNANAGGTTADRNTVRAAQVAVANSASNARVVNTDAFGLNSDNLHFNTAGQEALGYGFATQMQALVPAGGATYADTFMLTANDPSGKSSFGVGSPAYSGFNDSSGVNSNPTSDVNAPNYAYDTGALQLRTPAGSTSYAFGGGLLSIDAGGRMIGKSTTTAGSTITVPNLILNGGLVDEANGNNDGALLNLAGTITVNASSTLGALVGESMNVQATINGSSGLTVGGPNANGGADTGTVYLTGAAGNYAGPINVASGTLSVGNGGTTGTLGTGNVTLAGTLSYNRSGGVTIANPINGAGTLSLLASGNYTLSGGVTVGTLLLRNGTTTLGANVTVTGGSGAAVGYGSGDVAVLNIPTGTTFNAASTSFYVGRSTGATGTVNILGGTLIIPGFGTASSPGTFNIGGGVLQASANSTTFTNGIATFNVLAGGATVDTQAFNVSFGRALAGVSASPGGGLTKLGTGTLTLQAASTYTGDTLVTAGALRATNATGSATGTGTVYVSPVATLGGNGSVGAVVVAGTITAGADANTLGNLSSGAQTWNASGGYTVKIAGGTIGGTGPNDRLILSSLSGVAGGFTVNIASGNAPTGSYIVAVDTDKTAGSDPFVVGSLSLTVNGGAAPAGYGLIEQPDATGLGGVDLVFSTTATPEPGSLLLSTAAGASLLLGRRRRGCRLRLRDLRCGCREDASDCRGVLASERPPRNARE